MTITEERLANLTLDELLNDTALLAEIYRRAGMPNNTVLNKPLFECSDDEILLDIRVSKLLDDTLEKLESVSN